MDILKLAALAREETKRTSHNDSSDVDTPYVRSVVSEKIQRCSNADLLKCLAYKDLQSTAAHYVIGCCIFSGIKLDPNLIELSLKVLEKEVSRKEEYYEITEHKINKLREFQEKTNLQVEVLARRLEVGRLTQERAEVDWQSLFTFFKQRYGDPVSQSRYRVDEGYYSEEILTTFVNLTKENSSTLVEFLQDYEKRNLVKTLVHATHFVPKVLFSGMVKAGMACENPSGNQQYITVALWQDADEVANQLIYYLENGTDLEKSGAIDLDYHVPMRSLSDKMRDVHRNRFSTGVLKAFVSTTNLQLQRSAISRINFDEQAYSKDLKHDIKQAIEIAKNSDDEYIQNRYQIAIGESELFMMKHQDAE